MRIVVQQNMNHTAANDVIGGMMLYATRHPDFRMTVCGGHPGNAPLWRTIDRFDGMITDSSLLNGHLVQRMIKSCRALVLTDNYVMPRIDIPFARIGCDQRIIGEAAADLLLKKGLMNFGFVGAPDGNEWSNARCAAFADRIANTRGTTFSAYVSPRRYRFSQDRNALSEWLSALPKPCGVFVAFDQRALHVLDACAESKIDVPGQIQVVSVDNEPYVCELARPTLSSIAPDFEACGYMAAETLDKMLHDSQPPEADRTFGIRGIVERASTMDVRGTTRSIPLAMDFIRRYAASDITPADVAKSVGVSLRLLQLHFKSVLGHTIHDEIRSTRLTRVCDMLRDTSVQIDHIGDLCGFGNPNHLKTVFRKTFGCTMRDYRRHAPLDPIRAAGATATRT